MDKKTTKKYATENRKSLLRILTFLLKT